MNNTGMDPIDLDSTHAALVAKVPTYEAHLINTSNPHAVDSTDIGLNNVTNESRATMFTDPTFTGTLASISGVPTITDAIVLLNNGDAGGGITSGFGGIYIDRGSLDDAKIGFDETKSYTVAGLGTTMQRVALTDSAPTNGAIPIWDAASSTFTTAAGITAADVATIDGVLVFTNKTVDGCTFDTALTAAGTIRSSDSKLYMDADNGILALNSASPGTFALEVTDGDITLAYPTAGTSKNVYVLNYPITIFTETTADTAATANGIFIGVDADDRDSDKVTGYALQCKTPSHGDTCFEIRPRVGYSGTGTGYGQTKGYPLQSQLTDGIIVGVSSLGIGHRDPVHQVDVVGTFHVNGRLTCGGRRTVADLSVVRSGNAVEMKSDGTIQECKRAFFEPQSVDTYLDAFSIAETISGSCLVFASSRKVALFWKRETGSAIRYVVIGIDGSTITNLGNDTLSIEAVAACMIRATCMTCVNRGLILYVAADTVLRCHAFTLSENAVTLIGDPVVVASSTVMIHGDIVALSCQTAVVGYVDSADGTLGAAVITFQGDIATIGTVTTLASSPTLIGFIQLCKITETKVGMIYGLSNTSPACIVSISGTTATINTPSARDGPVSQTTIPSICGLTSDTLLVADCDVSAPNYASYQFGTINVDNSITFGARVAFHSATCDIGVAKISTNKVAIAFQDGTTAYYAIMDPALYPASPYMSTPVALTGTLGVGIGEVLPVPMSESGNCLIYRRQTGTPMYGRVYKTTLVPIAPFLEAEEVSEISSSYEGIHDSAKECMLQHKRGYVASCGDAVIPVSLVGEDIMMGHIFEQTTYCYRVLTCYSSTTMGDYLVSLSSEVGLNGSRLWIQRIQGDDCMLVNFMSASFGEGAEPDYLALSPISSTACMAASFATSTLRVRSIEFPTWDMAPTFNTSDSVSLSGYTVTGIYLVRVSSTIAMILGMHNTTVYYTKVTITTSDGTATLSSLTSVAGTTIQLAGKPSTDMNRIILYPYISATATLDYLTFTSNAGFTAISVSSPVTTDVIGPSTTMAPQSCYISDGTYAIAGSTTAGDQYVLLINSYLNDAGTDTVTTQLSSLTLSSSLGDVPHWIAPFNDEYVLSKRSVSGTGTYFSLIRIDREKSTIGIARETAHGGELCDVTEREAFCVGNFTAGRKYVADLDAHLTNEKSIYAPSMGTVQTGVLMGNTVRSGSVSVKPYRMSSRVIDAFD